MILPIEEFLRRFLLHLPRHPQLRLPRQPAARYALAALLPLTPKRSRNLSYSRIPRSGPLSLTLELPTLRWNHAVVERHPRAPARTKSLRLNWPTMPYQPSLQPRPVLSMRTVSRCNCRAPPPTATLYLSRACRPHTKPIRGCGCGFMQRTREAGSEGRVERRKAAKIHR
jgi:hypothetical protein